MYESTNNKLPWDFKIQIDNKIEHNKPVLELFLFLYHLWYFSFVVPLLVNIDYFIVLKLK